jgi:hypothetical protein
VPKLPDQDPMGHKHLPAMRFGVGSLVERHRNLSFIGCCGKRDSNEPVTHR